MRMIKCDPQPKKETLGYSICKEGEMFSFLQGEGIVRKLYAPAYVSPDGKPNWELRKIDGIWYWVKEE